MDDLDKIISRMIELSDNETQTDNFNVKEFQKFATDFYTKNSGIDFLNYFTESSANIWCREVFGYSPSTGRF